MVPLAMNSVLTNQQQSASKKRKRKFAVLYMRLLCKVLDNCLYCDETVEKMDMWLNFWIHKMIMDREKA